VYDIKTNAVLCKLTLEAITAFSCFKNSMFASSLLLVDLLEADHSSFCCFSSFSKAAHLSSNPYVTATFPKSQSQSFRLFLQKF